MKIRISTIDLVLCLSEAVDLISPIVANHHKYVACIAYQLSSELGLQDSEQKDITVAAALHDVGALSLAERLSPLNFDFEEERGHSERGYLLLNTYKPFSTAASLIRYHHAPWDNGKCIGVNSEKIPIGSHLLNLADRISVLIKANNNILGQTDEICKKITDLSGKIFVPELVDSFIKLSKKECFWLDIISGSLLTFIESKFSRDSLLEGYDFLELIKLFSRIIDFRSHFTATHSSGVAASAKAISRFAGFTESDSETIEIAGYIHDLGKLAVPAEILEKPGKLSKEEYEIVRTHTYYTDLILSKVKDFDVIRSWGALHHERLDGKGYPFHFDGRQLSTGSRIMAIADVFVALSEDRPYRNGLCRDETLLIIENMANSFALDINLVQLVKENYDYINNCRSNAQNAVEKEYSAMTLFSV